MDNYFIKYLKTLNPVNTWWSGGKATASLPKTPGFKSYGIFLHLSAEVFNLTAPTTMSPTEDEISVKLRFIRLLK